MGKVDEKEMHLNIYDQVLMNVTEVCKMARAKFPEYVAAKQFRLYLPKYIVEFINFSWKQYIPNRTAFGKRNFTEGISEFMGFPVYYNHCDEVVIAIVDFKYIKDNAPRIKMTDFTTSKPVFEYGN